MLKIYLRKTNPDSGIHIASCKREMLQQALLDFGIPGFPSAAKNEHGKPFFPTHPEFFYNFSDTGKWIALAASDADVGIDIQEVVTVKRGVDRLAGRFYPENEASMISAESDEQKKASLFFRMWTIREAYLKLLGTGLAGGISSFSVDYKEGQLTGICGNAHYCILPDPEPGVYLAVSQYQSSSPAVERM